PRRGTASSSTREPSNRRAPPGRRRHPRRGPPRVRPAARARARSARRARPPPPASCAPRTAPGAANRPGRADRERRDSRRGRAPRASGSGAARGRSSATECRWEPGRRRAAAVRLPAVDPEPGEEIFFHGHPSWRSLGLFYVKGLIVVLVAGVIAGLVTRISASHVQAGWVSAAVVAAF